MMLLHLVVLAMLALGAGFVALSRSADLQLTTLHMIDSCMYGIKYTEVPNMKYMEEPLLAESMNQAEDISIAVRRASSILQFLSSEVMLKTIVLVTGANSGVGYAITKRLAAAGADYHVILACRSIENAKTALAQIQADGIKGSFSVVQLDVTDLTSVEKAARSVDAEFGRVDVLINNAGVSSKDPSLKNQLDIVFATNATGPAIVTDVFKPLLLKSSNARLIYITSSLGSLTIMSDPNDIRYNVPAKAYSISKAALNMLMVQDAKELGPKGVKVWAMCPGFVESNLRGKTQEDYDAAAKRGALPASTSAETAMRIITGGEDANVGKYVHKDGLYPW